MVRQTESAKPRRSNMTCSSINAPAKKGGAGGSFTWGVGQDDADYELLGFDASTVGVQEGSGYTHGYLHTLGIFEATAPLDVDDENAFPTLSAASMNSQNKSKSCAPTSTESPVEETLDWVVVPVTDVSKNINKGTLDLFDNQHPRNLFSKKTDGKAKSEGGAQKSEIGIDWSQTGVPTEIKKQIINASVTASHRGLYGTEQVSSVPLGVLREQNLGSSRRQNSVPKSPRSRSLSKPRMKQPASRR